jgi:hypothetical protein
MFFLIAGVLYGHDLSRPIYPIYPEKWLLDESMDKWGVINHARTNPFVRFINCK